MYQMLQDSFPLRMKAFRLINEPTMMGYIFGLLRPFLKDKLHSRVYNGAHIHVYMGKRGIILF